MMIFGRNIEDQGAIGICKVILHFILAPHSMYMFYLDYNLIKL